MKEKKLSINAIRIIFLVPIFVMMIIFACVAAYVMHNAAKDSGWTVTQYSDLTGGQAGFYTLEDGAGHFLIVDGGWAGNEARVRDAIKMHNNHVDAWILTHPHQDHIGAFNAIYANPDGITIDRIYDSPVDYDVVKAFNDVYFYNNEYYTEVSNLEDINKYIEFGEIIYDDNLNIENSGLKINKNSIKI